MSLGKVPPQFNEYNPSYECKVVGLCMYVCLKGSNEAVYLKGSNEAVCLKGSNEAVYLKGSNEAVYLKGSNEAVCLKGSNEAVCTVDCRLLDTSTSANKVTWTNQIHADIIACKSDWSM